MLFPRCVASGKALKVSVPQFPYRIVLKTERSACIECLEGCMHVCMFSHFHGVMVCSLPGSSIHGIFPARIQEWIAISSSRASSWPRDQTHICFSRHIFNTTPPGNLHLEGHWAYNKNPNDVSYYFLNTSDSLTPQSLTSNSNHLNCPVTNQ